eukprot:gene4514-6993_t
MSSESQHAEPQLSNEAVGTDAGCAPVYWWDAYGKAVETPGLLAGSGERVGAKPGIDGDLAAWHERGLLGVTKGSVPVSPLQPAAPGGAGRRFAPFKRMKGVSSQTRAVDASSDLSWSPAKFSEEDGAYSASEASSDGAACRDPAAFRRPHQSRAPVLLDRTLCGPGPAFQCVHYEGWEHSGVGAAESSGRESLQDDGPLLSTQPAYCDSFNAETERPRMEFTGETVFSLSPQPLFYDPPQEGFQRELMGNGERSPSEHRRQPTASASTSESSGRETIRDVDECSSERPHSCAEESRDSTFLPNHQHPFLRTVGIPREELIADAACLPPDHESSSGCAGESDRISFEGEGNRSTGFHHRGGISRRELTADAKPEGPPGGCTGESDRGFEGEGNRATGFPQHRGGISRRGLTADAEPEEPPGACTGESDRIGSGGGGGNRPLCVPCGCAAARRLQATQCALAAMAAELRAARATAQRLADEKGQLLAELNNAHTLCRRLQQAPEPSCTAYHPPTLADKKGQLLAELNDTHTLGRRLQQAPEPSCTASHPVSLADEKGQHMAELNDAHTLCRRLEQPLEPSCAAFHPPPPLADEQGQLVAELNNAHPPCTRLEQPPEPAFRPPVAENTGTTTRPAGAVRSTDGEHPFGTEHLAVPVSPASAGAPRGGYAMNVVVERTRFLMTADLLNSDLYVVVSTGAGERFSTRVKHMMLRPVWAETFLVSSPDVRFQVRSRGFRRRADDPLLGEGALSLDRSCACAVEQRSLELTLRQKRVGALVVRCFPAGAAPPSPLGPAPSSEENEREFPEDGIFAAGGTQDLQSLLRTRESGYGRCISGGDFPLHYPLLVRSSPRRGGMPEYAHLVIAFTKIWEEFVEVKWEKIHFDGARLKRYHLLATSDKYKVERLFEPTENRYKLVGLEPGCELKVSVRAQFEGGEWGNWCSSEAVLHKQCSVTVGMVGPAFIHGHFNWGTDAESSETKTYGAAAGFQLRVRQKEKVLSTAVCDQELEAGQREFVVRGLLPDAIFNVQVRAVSAQGDVGRWSEVTRFLTLRDVVVHITEIGEDYSNIWWGRERADIGAAPPSAGSPSALEQFELRLDLHPTANQLLANLASDPVAVAEQSFGSDVCTYKLEALIPGRVYSIRTRQLNVQGDWSPWTSAKFRTLSRTSMVSAEAVSHDFMLISWGQERQEGTEAEMDLTTEVSVVNWQVRCVNTKTKEQSMVVLPAGETTTKIVNLPTSTEFALSARAKTSFGQWGPWSEASYVATVAPLQVRVEAVGEGWLKLNWARPEKRCDDAIQRYHVQIVAASSSFRLSKYFPADVTEYRFEDLSPNTEFLASIQACIADRWQPFSDALPTKTAGTAAVHLVRRGEDFIQIRWSSDFYDLNRVDPLDQKYQVKIIRHAPAGVDGAEDAPDECVTCQEFENVFGYRITKLTPGASVTIQARAFNASKEAWGGWSQPEVMKTLQSVISYTMIGETCVEAVWQRKPRTVSAVSDLVPVDNDPLAPSEAVMYILRVNRVHDDGTVTPLEKYHFTDQDKPFFLIENLEPNTTYSAQLCTADAQQTWSPWSAAAVVTTVPPIKLTIHEIGEDYCKVDWKRETLHAPASPSSASSPRALLHDDVETKYRITATSLVLDANGGLAAGSQLKYFVEGEQSFTLRHLEQDTSYRLSISAYPKNTNVWGVWSDAVYLRTCPSIDVELDTIGEDFARVSWRRKSPSSDLEKLHPCCEVVLVGGAAAAVEGDDAASRLTVMRNGVIAEQLSGLSPTPGYPLHIARPVVTQYCVKVYALGKSEEGEDTKTVQFESKLADGVTSLRIPQLEPNKAYEVVASACSSSGEWGVMSEPMPLQTTMSTEVFVASITYSYIRVKWGKGGPTATQALTEGEDDDTGVAPVAAADGEAPPVQQYLVQIVGPDDDFSKEVTLPGTQTQYDIHGLCINCCYSVSIRALQEGVWGHWSNPLVIAVRAIRVRMVEASQDWLKLSWYNRAVPEGQQRQLFITLIGDGRAMTRTLPSGSDTEFVFSELTPLTVYAVHLLCVEQVPAYIKAGGWKPEGSTNASALPESGRPTDTGITVALPLIASDYSSFYT